MFLSAQNFNPVAAIKGKKKCPMAQLYERTCLKCLCFKDSLGDANNAGPRDFYRKEEGSTK